MDLAIWITHTLREGLGELAKLKNMLEDQQNQQPPKVEAWGIYSHLGKTSHFIVVAIPDTSGMTYTAPTVTKLPRQCEASELPTRVGTPDPQQILKPCN